MVNNILILGGSGYIGKHCAYKLLQLNQSCVVTLVSRRLNNKLEGYNSLNQNQLSRLRFIKGDALDPLSFLEAIKESTGIIHSIGALLTTAPDTSKDSYEMKNRQSAIRPATLANEWSLAGNKKNFVYISAERGLPFPLSLKFSGYIETKRKTEAELKLMENLNSIVLRPGIVKDNKQRSWSIPLFLVANIISKFEKFPLSKFPTEAIKKLELPSAGTELDILADTAARAALGISKKNLYSAEDLIRYDI